MANVENGEYDAAITALETRPDTDEKAQAYLAYAKAAKALAGNDLDTAEAELDRFADYEPLQEKYAQMNTAYDQMLFDDFFAAIQAGDSNAKKYWDKANAAGSFTPEQCYQVAQWIVTEGHVNNENRNWVDTLLAGQEQTAAAVALLEQNDLQYAEKMIAAEDIDESSYRALKDSLAKYTSEQAQQMSAEWDALWEKEQKYQAAYAILTSQNHDADYSAASQILEELGDYKDSEDCLVDAQNLISLAKFLGIYHDTEFISTTYTASGAVYTQSTLTGEQMSLPIAVIYYSFDKHCLMYANMLEEVPTVDELEQQDRGFELTVVGNTFSYHTIHGEESWTLSGDYIYSTGSYDTNIVNNPIKHTVSKLTSQRIG